VLDEAGIPHKTIRRQDHLFNFNNQSPYEVGVPASLYEKAELAIKEAFGTEGEAGDAIPMLNEQNRESFERLVNQPIEQKLKQRPEEEIPGFLESLSNLGGWIRKYDDGAGQMGGTAAAEREFFPEDATSFAWDGDPAEARETRMTFGCGGNCGMGSHRYLCCRKMKSGRRRLSGKCWRESRRSRKKGRCSNTERGRPRRVTRSIALWAAPCTARIGCATEEPG